MIEKLLSNEIYVVLLAIVVLIFPFLICCFHFLPPHFEEPTKTVKE